MLTKQIALACAVMALLLARGALAEDEETGTTVLIGVTVLEVPQSSLAEFGMKELAKAAPEALSMGAPSSGKALQVTQLPIEKLEELKRSARSGKGKAKLVWTSAVIAREGKQAVAAEGEREIHYMEKVTGNLYKLKTLKQPGDVFRATPTVTDQGIKLALQMEPVILAGRTPLPEAPDLEVGLPIFNVQAVSTQVVVREDRALVMSVLEMKGVLRLVCITAKVAHE